MGAILLPNLSCSAQPAPTVDRTTEAKAFVALLAQGEFAKATSTFDATMLQALPETKLKSVWEGLIKQAGAFKQTGGARMEKTLRYDVAFITCVFERAQLDAKVVYNADGRISGLFFVPSTPLANDTPAPYVSRDTFDERDFTLGSKPWLLPGTLSLPKGDGPFPCVVLVHGSGPQDRDETLGANKPFRDLAWGLATRGIAVLRYEKRTREHAASLQPLPLPFTVNEETVYDAVDAVQALRSTPKIDDARIFVLGHSLGGMLIPRIAAQSNYAAGFIVLAGTTRPLEDVIIEQTNYLALLDGAKTMAEEKRIDAVQTEIDRIKKLTDADAADPAILFGAPASYWLDLRGYDPAASAKPIDKPMLLLQGERDYQVTMVDFDRWKSALAGKPNVTFKQYPTLNHLFMEGEGPGNPNEYSVPGHVAQRVIDDIADWVKQ